MQNFSRILSRATAAVGEVYFHLPIHGGAPTRRERVYCYELYHQMRLLWPREEHYVLNGELDKRGHPALDEPSAPDFLVHLPGSWDHNYAIIEVKPCSASAKGFRKDVQRLSNFIHDWQYQRAILLVYGGDVEQCVHKAEAAYKRIERVARIEVWHHAYVGVDAAQAAILSRVQGAA